MVQFMNTATAAEAAEKGKRVAVKREVEDHFEESTANLNKRSRSSIHHKQSGMGSMVAYEDGTSQYNPLNEPSPLGLRLRKSPSLLELIQMRLSETNAPAKGGGHGRKDHKGASSSSSAEKLKASNFAASILRIGTWEYKSRYEGDLVAKCYFAKHKLVWEVLDGGLKNKIEIQWSDIMAIKAKHPDDEPGTLDVVLSRQPLFYRETNPQPRKHTLWQATSDFTNGQASLNRRHFLQFPQGLLGKHFEKLIQCDPRLNYLSQQPEITLDSPFFEPRLPIFEDLSEQTSSFERSPSPFNMRDISSPSGVQSSSSRNEHGFVGSFPESLHQDSPSPSSVMENHASELMKNIGSEQWKNLSTMDNIRVPGLSQSMSMTDLVSHLEQRMSEQRTSNDFALSQEERKSLDVLEEISRCLFSDTQNMPASDEKSLMSRVNSLCCLLQKDPSTVQNSQSRDDNHVDGAVRTGERHLTPVCETSVDDAFSARDTDEVSDCKQTSPMTRNDSVGDLLLNLPRIASLPQFLFNLGDDYDNQAR